MIFRLFTTISLFFLHTLLYSQLLGLKGIVVDSIEKTPLIGATGILSSDADTAFWKGVTTNLNGEFEFKNVPSGNYLLKISFISYKTYTRRLSIFDQEVNLGAVSLSPDITILKGVVVQGRQQRAVIKGDTVQFNANTFKTNPDANTEDLVTKMPGITSEGGTVKINGENVQQILVDGKPFFGNDANVALKNLPAEVVEKIEVFDRLSEQSQFTGFDDGQTSKTINIVTKPGANQGQFGKLYAGYGSDGRYICGGNVNLFKGDRRISIIGLTNNINQQNFSTEDLAGALSGSNNQNRGRGGNRGGGGGGPRGDNGINNFLVGQQGGITKTYSFGLNYSDNWGSKTKISASYFFNKTDNFNNTYLNRTYITALDTGFFYRENSISRSDNSNHRFNAKIEYNLDSSNSIIVTPSLSFQDNDNLSSLSGGTFSSDSVLDSSTENIRKNNNIAYNVSSNVLYRHKFNKKGRTLSLSVEGQANNRFQEGKLNSTNIFNENETDIYDQKSEGINETYNFSSRINYTEPLSEKSQLQINYNPSYRIGYNNKKTKNYDFGSENYVLLDTALSNRFENAYMSHSAGISYRFNDRKLNVMAGINVQHATLDGDQLFPAPFVLTKTFQNILPQASFNYKFSKEKNLRVRYRTSTNAPSIHQLQKVIDNSNPILLSTGNPNLKQEYTHALSLRYGNTRAEKTTSFFVMMNANYTKNYIANATYFASNDTLNVQEIIVAPGTQLSLPVNLDGFWSARSFVTYAFPVSFIKSNLNLNTGFTFNETPANINNRINLANNYNFSEGIVLSSNISENIDFSLGYTANYSIVKNTLQKQSDNNYFNQNINIRANWLFGKGFVFHTILNYTQYQGISQSINQEFMLWNASFGYKFLKDKSLELKATVFDILNRNNSIARNVTETYIEDSQTTILKRYFLVTLTYSLRKFGKK